MCDSLSPNPSSHGGSLDVQNMLLKHLCVALTALSALWPRSSPAVGFAARSLGTRRLLRHWHHSLCIGRGSPTGSSPSPFFSSDFGCPSPSLLKINFASDINPLSFSVLSPWEKAGSGRWSTGSKGEKRKWKIWKKVRY